MTSEIEQAISSLYQELKKRSPNFVNWKVTCHPDLMQAAGLHPGDVITGDKIPVFPDLKIGRVSVGNNKFQSDIWIVGKPRQRHKFRRYSKT